MRTSLCTLSILALSYLSACSSGPADEAAEPAPSESAQPSTSGNEEAQPVDGTPATVKADEGVGRVELSDAEWRERLTDEQYYILRDKGTEHPGTGHLLKSKTAGTYVCAGCGLSLFDSSTKFDSGSGWPSFYSPIEDGHVAEKSDRSLRSVRTEVLCARCDGHLGHVFPDGPRPTGLRYCINSASLELEPADQ